MNVRVTHSDYSTMTAHTTLNWLLSVHKSTIYHYRNHNHHHCRNHPHYNSHNRHHHSSVPSRMVAFYHQVCFPPATTRENHHHCHHQLNIATTTRHRSSSPSSTTESHHQRHKNHHQWGKGRLVWVILSNVFHDTCIAVLPGLVIWCILHQTVKLWKSSRKLSFPRTRCCWHGKHQMCQSCVSWWSCAF